MVEEGENVADEPDAGLSDEYCSHAGCVYHAIKRRPLCIFHVREDESELDVLKRKLSRPTTAGMSLRDLERRAAHLAAELRDVEEKIEASKEKARRDLLARQKEQRKKIREEEGPSSRRRCTVEGCAKFAIRGGICVAHGAPGKKPCSVEGCSNQSANRGVCVRHGAKVTLCGHEGCTKYAQRGRVCNAHGAIVRICEREGCTNQARRGGVCRRHGGKVECAEEGCTNYALKFGFCWSHGASEYLSKRKRKQREDG